MQARWLTGTLCVAWKLAGAKPLHGRMQMRLQGGRGSDAALSVRLGRFRAHHMHSHVQQDRLMCWIVLCWGCSCWLIRSLTNAVS